MAQSTAPSRQQFKRVDDEESRALAWPGSAARRDVRRECAAVGRCVSQSDCAHRRAVFRGQHHRRSRPRAGRRTRQGVEAIRHRREPSGIAGTASVAKSAPDGYTLMLTSNGHTIASVVNKICRTIPRRTLPALRGCDRAAGPDHPARPVRQDAEGMACVGSLQAGEMNFSSAGLASTSYLGAEMLSRPPRSTSSISRSVERRRRSPV